MSGFTVSGGWIDSAALVCDRCDRWEPIAEPVHEVALSTLLATAAAHDRRHHAGEHVDQLARALGLTLWDDDEGSRCSGCGARLAAAEGGMCPNCGTDNR